jgi:hypothetical protein
VVVAVAVVVAAGSARVYPGSWNDESRLATVEALVDRHTLAIDGTLFGRATCDKIYVAGRFYSHKPPVPALLLAGLYLCLQWATGLTALRRPEAFCYWLTLGSSGLAYVVAVWCVWRLGRPLRLSRRVRLLLAASLGLATLALPYASQVNDHLLLLAVAAALVLNLAEIATREGEAPAEPSAPARREPRPPDMPRPPAQERVSSWRLFGVGALAGLGYTLDLGSGPVLLLCTFGLILYRGRRRPGVTPVAFLLGALPWLALHHAVNYAVAGTWVPAAAVPQFFRWPGSPFTAADLTGGWKHHDLPTLLGYAKALLVGPRGFLVHNLPLLLALVALPLLLWGRVREWPELLWGAAWATGTWLLYAACSNNFAGWCCSIRWFVPLLAPGYFTLAVLLRERPRFLGDLCVLSGWGMGLAGYAWWHGPWSIPGVPYVWPFRAAFACWAGYRLWDWTWRQAVCFWKTWWNRRSWQRLPEPVAREDAGVWRARAAWSMKSTVASWRSWCWPARP